MRQSAREAHRPRVRPGGEPVDFRPPGIAEPEEFCHLVDALPRGVVARLPEDRQVERRGDAKQRGVAAGDDQRQVRQARPPGAEIDRQRVGVQVVHLDERHAPPHRERLAEGCADQQRPHQPGAGGHGDRAEVGGRHPGLVERGLHDGDEVLQVLAPGDLRHDAAVGAVVGDLGGDDGGEHAPALLDDRGRGFVARCFDAEDGHAPRAGAASSWCRRFPVAAGSPVPPLPASAAASAVPGPAAGLPRTSADSGTRATPEPAALPRISRKTAIVSGCGWPMPTAVPWTRASDEPAQLAADEIGVDLGVDEDVAPQSRHPGGARRLDPAAPRVVRLSSQNRPCSLISAIRAPRPAASSVNREPMWLFTPTAPGKAARFARTWARRASAVIEVSRTPSPGSLPPSSRGSIGWCRSISMPRREASFTVRAVAGNPGMTAIESGIFKPASCSRWERLWPRSSMTIAARGPRARATRARTGQAAAGAFGGGSSCGCAGLQVRSRRGNRATGALRGGASGLLSAVGVRRAIVVAPRCSFMRGAISATISDESTITATSSERVKRS